MISLDEAREYVLSRCRVAEPVGVPLRQALGLVVAEKVIAPENIPPFPNTAVDGFAVISNRIEPSAHYTGNGYEATDLARIPWNLVDAIDLWESSTVAREAFGEDVHFHILNMAKQEWAAFNATVTDWELRRYWERV